MVKQEDSASRPRDKSTAYKAVCIRQNPKTTACENTFSLTAATEMKVQITSRLKTSPS